ncbi:TetR/AcrR family transcriptional regulator [Nocardia rhizosphaerihabitans]|uniref:TetR-family transcriptional regulator n=1 Tax=Nocardia rhizosphaerihabitans TaxID=1691570 RepID=A0ABQ2KVQ5_9NOCA|nr:TetR/AcrR family transcriptional regulator [Nocardia rhizosphaerihabitans]GGN91833.1 putative TetR-family transcriptional regulator [Nocardia rhizosphaerihabitans]
MKSPRRQADRRAATVTALLDATIDSLVEVGYAGTTTRSVAERAGVSQGAQQHYFRTKTDLVDAAMIRLVEQLVADANAQPIDADNEAERAAALLDRLWEIHNLPITPAVFELFNVARTDPEIATQVKAALARGMDAIRTIAHALLPTFAARPDFDDTIDIIVATVRGTVIIAAIPGADTLHSPWPKLKEHLLAQVITDPAVAVSSAAHTN